jgi:hypothetical protein
VHGLHLRSQGARFPVMLSKVVMGPCLDTTFPPHFAGPFKGRPVLIFSLANR